MNCWQDELERARSEDEVIRSASDFLQVWAPRRIDPMQLGLIELRIESCEDIERVRRSLRREEAFAAAESSADAAHLKELASFLSQAATRASELRAR